MKTYTQLRNDFHAGLPAGMSANRTLPLESALQVVLPFITKNDPERASAIPTFSDWIKTRGLDLSVDNAIWLWTNFSGQYFAELPARVSQWRHSRNMPGLKGPAQLVQELLLIWMLTVFQPWKSSLQSTPLGRLGYGCLWLLTLVVLMGVLVPTLLFVMSHLLFVGAYVGEALKFAPALLGF